MADFADMAADSEAQFRAQALDAFAARRPDDAAAPSALECEDCGEPIPEARRRARPGCTRCVACQTLYDRQLR